MEKFEEKPKTREEFMDDIILEACGMQEFQDAVKTAKNTMEAMKNIRILLDEHFPEIKKVPEIDDGLTHPGNEFIITKEIFKLLSEK